MELEEERKKNSFKSILKGTSIFGGVQVFNILVSAVRLKFVAVILGASGIGVAGLFNSLLLTIQQFASLGVNLAVVKEIGAANDDRDSLRHVVAAVRPLAVLLSLAGALVCLLLPGVLSEFTFGSLRYAGGMRLLGAAVFFSVSGGVLMSVLQGLHEVRRLSTASVIGSLVGLLVGVPMYWVWGTEGIVPAMVALSGCTFFWYWWSLRKSVAYHAAKWRREVHLPILRRIVLMGIILMSNDFFRNIVNYLVNIYVRTGGGEVEVGLFSSCSTMTSQYSAIVFTAMAMDYLPRLSAAAGDNGRMCEVVNRQMEVVGLFIAPMVCAVLLFAPFVIQVLQSSEFMVATPLLRLLALAVVLRALMYPLGYIVFAKDNRRLFFWMESVGANILTLLLTCGGYALWGLNGLGVAAIADCVVCFAVYVLVNRILYGYRMSGIASRVSAFAIAVTAAMAAVCFLLDGLPLYCAAIPLLSIVSLLSLHRLSRLWKTA